MGGVQGIRFHAFTVSPYYVQFRLRRKNKAKPNEARVPVISRQAPQSEVLVQAGCVEVERERWARGKATLRSKVRQRLRE